MRLKTQAHDPDGASPTGVASRMECKLGPERDDRGPPPSVLDQEGSTPDPGWLTAKGWLKPFRLVERRRRLEAGEPLVRILR
jgi:hypothetical protein